MEVFNRGGFTGGYYKEYHGKDMMSMKRPDHQRLYVGKISKLMKGKDFFYGQEDILREMLCRSVSIQKKK